MGLYGKFDISRKHCSTTVVASLMAWYLNVETAQNVHTTVTPRKQRSPTADQQLRWQNPPEKQDEIQELQEKMHFKHKIHS